MQNIQLSHIDHKSTTLKYPLCFLSHDVTSPTNIGGFFRIADALGVEKIYLTGNSICPPNPKLKKLSRSAEKYVAYEYADNPISIVDQLKADGYKIVSLEITSESIDLAEFQVLPTDKICLILGAESHGISEELLAVSDHTIHIPMLGENSSMNVASACSIATYTLTRQLEKVNSLNA